MPDYFRKRPVLVKGVQWTGDNQQEIQTFTGDQFRAYDTPPYTGQVYDKLHATWIPLQDDDWILEGIDGEYYPCRPDIMAATYEPADATGSHTHRLAITATMACLAAGVLAWLWTGDWRWPVAGLVLSLTIATLTPARRHHH